MTKPKNAKPYHDTTVTVLKSRTDIAGLLERWGVENVQWTIHRSKTALRFQFDHEERTYTARLVIDPEEQGVSFEWAIRKKSTEEEQLKKHLGQESRRLHRTLYWYVKSKLEAIDAGLETPAQAWLAAIEGPRGHTIYQEIEEQLREIVAGDLGTMPALPPARSDA